MVKFKYYIFSFLALLSSVDSNAKVVLTATNTSQHQRQEVVAWSANDVWRQLGVKEGSSLIVKNPYGQTVTHQITHDGRLLLDVSVRPEGTAGFTVEQGNSADFKVKANQAYLCAPEAAGAKMLNIDFGGDATAINGVEAEASNANTQVYTIDGKKANRNNLAKGQVYVTKGKTFILK